MTLPPKYKNVLRVYKSVGRLELSVSNMVNVLTVVLEVEARVIAAVLATVSRVFTPNDEANPMDVLIVKALNVETLALIVVNALE